MYALPPAVESRKPEIQLVALTDSMRPELARVAAADGHAVIHPTHAVRRGNEIVGYASLGAVPMFFAWMDTRRASARDSFTAWHLAEKQLRQDGHRVVCLPCTVNSPFAPLLSRQGYQSLGPALLNLKELHVP